jgi:hypothetical protein
MAEMEILVLRGHLDKTETKAQEGDVVKRELLVSKEN